METEGLRELLREQRRLEAYPLFVGAVAVSKSWTLVTDKYPFTMALKEAKERIKEVPERFRPRIENVDVYMSYILEVSDEVDNVFSLLNCYADKVAWVHYWGSMGEGRGNGFLGNQYVMEDVDAATYIDKQGFTAEEIEWLWALAQAMHVLSDKPVERREIHGS